MRGTTIQEEKELGMLVLSLLLVVVLVTHQSEDEMKKEKVKKGGRQWEGWWSEAMIRRIPDPPFLPILAPGAAAAFSKCRTAAAWPSSAARCRGRQPVRNCN